MKKKIGIFIFIVICSTVMLSDWIERIYRQTCRVPGRYNNYVGIQKEQKDSIDMLVIGDSEHDIDISDGIVEKYRNYKLYMWTIWSAHFRIVLYVKACFRLSVTAGRTIGN